ncbi:hypothetical protein TRICI_001229 [Trichomonascus ciferrii]|uniref:NADP-dependent oxidoreductase domain-containing protein n=1 Tax=Trichomonascus ciferrii TaxID=44093 RepID=A0A642V9Z5_9ASCO|nr:hypothetical protein TRICI_001229 [Trichomonascus ciferrii]
MTRPCTDFVVLNTGYKMPVLGFGTFQKGHDAGYKGILTALKAGYRHIDTAAVYGTEEDVGRAVRDSGIPREEIFITTKLGNGDHRDPFAALNRSLETLGLDYVDLYLMHWPVALANKNVNPFSKEGIQQVDFGWNHVKTWELMQELPKTGKVRSIGVSNYDTVHYKQLLDAPTTNIIPAVNQVEAHPYLPETKLLRASQKKGIVLTAYSPLGSADLSVLEDNDIAKLAKKYSANPAQITLSWQIQRGFAAIPKSSTPSRIESNFQVVNLAPEDMETMNSIYKKHHQRRFRYAWPVKMYHDDDEWYDGNPPPSLGD